MDLEKDQGPKKPYRSPKLTVYGSITILTQSLTRGGGQHDSTNPYQNNKT
jgi:hypothetical protein